MTKTTIWLDTETGGVEDRHPTIQLAAIATRDWQEIDHVEAKIRFDESACEPEALELNGYDAAKWDAASVSPAEALALLADFCREHADVKRVSKKGKPYRVARIGGHNVASFDIPRIRRGMEANAIFWPAQWWYPLDTYHRAIWHFADRGEQPGEQPENFRLATLAEHLGIDCGEPHDALVDCRIAMRLARWFGEDAEP